MGEVLRSFATLESVLGKEALNRWGLKREQRPAAPARPNRAPNLKVIFAICLMRGGSNHWSMNLCDVRLHLRERFVQGDGCCGCDVEC